MKRIIRVVTAVGLVAAFCVPAMAQEGVNPIDVLIDALGTQEGQEFSAQFLKDPVSGASQVSDPPGDFEHSTGEPPGYTPDHIDIVDTWSLDFQPMPVDGFFTPTSENQFWAPTGRLDVETESHGTLHTFSGSVPHDGSQYDDGALLFGFTLVDTPPVEVPGRCEYVVWVNDLARGETFTSLPEFPDDPAGGTNVAFGLGLNPDDQQPTSTFTFDLTEAGSFASAPDIDVRAFITPGYVGITVPQEAIGDLAQVNFYTFCVESGFSFAPEETGADQTGLIDLTPDELGILAIEPAPEPAPATTTTAPETTTASPPEITTTTAATTTTMVGATEIGDAFPWWALIVGGLGLGGLGWFLYAGGGDCRKLYEAWVAAQEACRKARAAADETAEVCEQAERDLEDREDERSELCKAWPPACWETEDGGWVEDDQGKRVTSRDLHMKRIALGGVWDDYKSGKLSAQDVEERWEQMDTPEFREELRETDETFKEELAELDGEISAAREKADEACEKAATAQKKADEECAAADQARKRYEECIGTAMAAAAAGPAPGGDGEGSAPTGSGAPGTTTSPTEAGEDPCEGVEPKRTHKEAGPTERIRVNVDFSVMTGVAEGSERQIAAGQELVLNLNDLARDLDFLGDMAGARAAGLHIGGAVNGFAQGKYVATSAGVIRGGIEAASATDVAPEVPTSPVQAGTEFLEGVSRLGATVAGKVTEWMRGNQIMLLWTTMFYQVIEATPYTIWECRGGVGWVCVEKVWEFEVGRLQKHPPNPNVKSFIVESDLNRARFEAEIRRQSQIAANRVRNDARHLIEWRARHEPRPCP